MPKIFKSFYVDYKNKIKFFVRTSEKILDERKLEDKVVKIVPFWMIQEVFKDI